MRIEDMELDEIVSAALDDGIEVTEEQARAIRAAAATGSLMWTPRHIITTDGSRLHLQAPSLDS